MPGRDSCIWRFNALYWQALSGGLEQATGREYEQSLPGGESDARNTEAARELILELFRIWDELAARRALPEELYNPWNSASGTGTRPAPGWTSSSSSTGGTGASTTTGSATRWATIPRTCSTGPGRPWPTTASGSARW